jgi:K+-transporting ATPase ATPase C chain
MSLSMPIMRTVKISIVMVVAMTVLCGIVYPLVVTGIAHVLFPRQADGSMIVRNGTVVGSSLIGQRCDDTTLFQPRPSAAGDGYDPRASGGTNAGPTNPVYIGRVRRAVDSLRRVYPGVNAFPADMVTTSASGLDPDITLANALIQAPRVARMNGLPHELLLSLVHDLAQSQAWGFLGEERVNVVALNSAVIDARTRR